MEDLSVDLNSGHRVSVSADEAAIRRRGKRRIPASFSPEREENGGSVTPMAGTPRTPGTPGEMSRSRREVVATRRKLFSDGDGPVQSQSDPENGAAASPAKKMKTTTELSFTINNNVKDDPISETPKKMAALSKGQLVKLLSEISLCPSLMEQITPLVPEVPDITRQLASLEKHSQNVFKAMPKSRLTNHHDSISYSRVYLHLNSFHNVLVEDLHSLVLSEHWPTVIRYVMNAWPIVDKSPVWEDSPHNRARVSCYRSLANAGVKAIKSYKFEESVREKLLSLMAKSSNMDFQGQIHELKSL